MMQVTPCDLRELLTTDLTELSAKFRFEKVQCLSVPIGSAPITLLIFCAPRNHLWRATHFDSINLPTNWKDDMRRVLIEEGALGRELRRSNLPKKSFPLGLLEIDEEEQYCHGRFDWDGLWFQSVLVPRGLASALVEYVDQWVEQLGALAFSEIADLTWLNSSANLVRASRSGCFRTINELHIMDNWAGTNGLLTQLESLVKRLEAGEQVSALLPWSFTAFESDPIDIDRAFILRPRGRRAITKDFVPESFQETKRVLDTIFALRARLVRLSMLPQFYRAAKMHQTRTHESVIAHPFSVGLPYDPIHELECYIAEQRKSFPILDVEPYPPDVFQRIS